ncbi:hypothetical protein [Streptomyces soliscabiei]|nr:hypothetical protein [Streptomyces sp. NY05-11A]MDX2679553.1 hypothetical protein [Streptomyces sp. NY05-11A]
MRTFETLLPKYSKKNEATNGIISIPRGPVAAGISSGPRKMIETDTW